MVAILGAGQLLRSTRSGLESRSVAMHKYIDLIKGCKSGSNLLWL